MRRLTTTALEIHCAWTRLTPSAAHGLPSVAHQISRLNLLYLMPILMIGCFAFALPLRAETMGNKTFAFPSESTALYSGTTGSGTFGILTPGTSLQVTGPASNGRIPVTIEGWSTTHAPYMIFLAAGQAILELHLSPSSSPPQPSKGKAVVVRGITWKPVSYAGWVKSSATVPNVDAVWTAASNLYQTQCAQCHGLYQPDELTANQWPSVLHTMSHNAALTPEQTALITQYLQRHAKGQ
jgi:trimethylamine-N-oxide reductase cytochrome c-type subunit TorC